jgi:hypothetical protein
VYENELGPQRFTSAYDLHVAMSSITPIAEGTYYISSQLTSTFLTLDSGGEGTNVSAWQFDGGTHQQVLVGSVSLSLAALTLSDGGKVARIRSG